VIFAARHLVGGHPPPCRLHHVVHRQAAPQVAHADEPVQPGVRHEDHVGFGTAGDGRQGSAGPRRQQVRHGASAVGQVMVARLVQPADPAVPPARCPVTPLREDHQCGVALQPPGQALDLLDKLAIPGTAAAHEHIGHAVGYHVHGGIELHRRGHHDVRAAAAGVEQVVHEQERVAGPGVAAQHDHRPGRAGRVVPRARILPGASVRPGDLDLKPEQPASRPVHHVQEPVHDRIVTGLVGLGVQAAAEPAREPQSQEHEQRRGVSAEPGERERQQPQAAHAPRPLQPGQADQEHQHREHREQHRDRDGDDHGHGREYQPADQPGW